MAGVNLLKERAAITFSNGCISILLLSDCKICSSLPVFNVCIYTRGVNKKFMHKHCNFFKTEDIEMIFGHL